MLNHLLKCSVWIIKNQLDGSYVPGVSEPHENEQALYFVIEVHLKCPYFKTVGN